METYLTTSIEPIEVAFVRSGLDAALDVAAVKAVESGALALEAQQLRATGIPGAGDPLTQALIAVTSAPRYWKNARDEAKERAQAARRELERKLVARGLLREPSPWRWAIGRRTERGNAWLSAAQLAFPAAQIAGTDPALALALHGTRALDGTRYHPATVAAQNGSTDGGGCGASFAGDGGHGHGGGHGHDGHGHGGCGGGHGGCSGGGGGCGGGGCGSGGA
ncbi:MAG TPA: hypothetical protein VK669_10045 [Candidatus Limnocylindrales bacterium]|nr:hypothetical protein [Candidatus Limnocylindrales bacterium]